MRPALELQNRQNFIPVDRGKIAAALVAAAGRQGKRISVAIVDDETIRGVNREFLGRDRPTDVIAFDYGPGGAAAGGGLCSDGAEGAAEDVAGELIVSAQTALEEAARRGRDPEEELLLYVIHGALHLEGYGDGTPEEAADMRAREREVCAELGLGDPWKEEAGAKKFSGPPSRLEPVSAYTDGACSGNPGPGGWGVRILYPDGRLREAGGAAGETTNNRMELTAAVEALKITREDPLVEVVTDSQYLRLGITRWLAGWRKRGWLTVKGEPVKNRDLWEKLAALLRPGVRWRYVAGHTGDPHNERCDEIAVSFSMGRPVDLFDGYAPFPLPGREAPSEKTGEGASRSRKKKRKKSAGGYYLSLVGGVLCRHETWAECEARVKGVSRARFKKCSGRKEEREILDAWGVGSNRAP